MRLALFTLCVFTTIHPFAAAKEITKHLESASMAVKADKGAPLDASALDLCSSKSGRYVFFRSRATNFGTVGDADNYQLFRYDRKDKKRMCISTSPSGDPAIPGVLSIAASDNGRFVAFSTSASNLGFASNGSKQVYWQDLKTGERIQISKGFDGEPANLDCAAVSISGDGKVVGFASMATNLAPVSNTGVTHIWARGVHSPSIERISSSKDDFGANGESSVKQGCALSKDGRYVAFSSLATNLDLDHLDGGSWFDVFVKDRMTGAIESISRAHTGGIGNSNSFLPRLSADGRIVAFVSAANNLVEGEPADALPDLYFFDRQTQSLSRVEGSGPSRPLVAIESTTISADGRYVAAATRELVGDPVISLTLARTYDRATSKSTVYDIVSPEDAGAIDAIIHAHLSGSGSKLFFNSGSPTLCDASYSPQQVFLTGR